MTGKGKDFKRYVILFQLAEFVFLTSASIAMIVMNQDDFAFSIAMTVFLLTFCLHFAGLLLFIIISTTSVLNTVEKAPTITADNADKDDGNRRRSMAEAITSMAAKPFLQKDDRKTSLAESFNNGSSRLVDRRTENLIKKVRLYRKFGQFAGPLVVLAMFVVCLLEWILGGVPLMWCVFAVSVMHFPVVGFAQTRLAKSSVPAKDSSSTQQLLLTSSPAMGLGSSTSPPLGLGNSLSRPTTARSSSLGL